MAKRALIDRMPCCEVTLQPGEMLFLPSMWWHEVTAVPNDDNPDGCMSVSHQYHPFYARYQEATACSLGPMLANPLYEEAHAGLEGNSDS